MCPLHPAYPHIIPLPSYFIALAPRFRSFAPLLFLLYMVSYALALSLEPSLLDFAVLRVVSNKLVILFSIDAQ